MTSSTPETDQPLFAAFRGRPGRRGRLWLLAVLLLLAVVEGGVIWSSHGAVQISTARGLRTVKRGMTLDQVRHELGQPLAMGPAQPGQECFEFGQPSWRSAFAVYSLCFEAGSLTQVLERRFGVWRVARDGTLIPFKDPSPR